MATSETFTVPVESEPRLKLDHVKGNGTQVFTLAHRPHYGMLNPSPTAPYMILSTPSYGSFDPGAQEVARTIKVGDFIRVLADPNDPIYSMLSVPDAFKIPEGFEAMVQVQALEGEYLGAPVIVCDSVI